MPNPKSTLFPRRKADDSGDELVEIAAPATSTSGLIGQTTDSGGTTTPVSFTMGPNMAVVGSTLRSYMMECTVSPTGGDYTTLGAALAAGKRHIFIRNGTYTETGENTITNCSIVGESRDGVIIDVDSTTSDRFLLGAGPIEIRNVTFRGPSGGTDYLIESTSTVSIAYLVMNNVTFKWGGFTAFTDAATCYVNVTDCAFDIGTNTSSGFYFDSSGSVPAGNFQKIAFVNNVVKKPFTLATTGTASYVKIQSFGTEIWVIGNKMLDLGGGGDVPYGIKLTGSGSITRMLVCNNSVGFTGLTYGVHMTNPLNSTVANNEIDVHGGTTGIYLISGASQADSPCHVISGNNLENGQANGIEIGNNTTFVNIVGNAFRRNNTCLILFGGTGVNHVNVAGNANFTNPGDVVAPVFVFGSRGAIVNIAEDNHGLRPTEVSVLRRFKNTSGGSLAIGTLVVLKSVAAGDEMTTTTTVGDPKVVGVLVETTANNSTGHVLTKGKTTVLKVDGTTDIAVGDYLSTFSTAGLAAKASSGDTAFAIALEAYTADDGNGVIDALLISPQKI